VNGVAGTAMQAFGEQLNAVDLAAVITYERNAFGNNAGDMVQPADIAAAK
jgi:cytochrome c oxidase subunit 2